MAVRLCLTDLARIVTKLFNSAVTLQVTYPINYPCAAHSMRVAVSPCQKFTNCYIVKNDSRANSTSVKHYRPFRE